MSDNTTMPLYVQQLDDVHEMQNQLLTFNKKDPNAARKAIQNVTMLRVYHQLARIVRFTEMLDKLEDRYYQSIDAKLDEFQPDDPDAWFTLIPIAERLQKMMIDSHKLLEPYLNLEQLSTLEVAQDTDPSTSFTSIILEQESREKVRTGVQQLMDIINTFDTVSQDAQPASDAIQSKAQEALAKISQGIEITSEELDINDRH